MATGSSSQRGLESADDSEFIRSMMGSIRFAFDQVDTLEAVLLAREQRLKRELEEKERRIDVLQLAGLEKIKLEDDLSKSRRECSKLREDLRFSKAEVLECKEEIMRLKSRVSGDERELGLLKLKHEYLQKSTEFEIGLWEKRYKVLENRVVAIMEEVKKLPGVDAGMDCEVDVRRRGEVGHGVVLEESGMDIENAAENCKQVGGDMKQEVGVGDSCSQKLVNEGRMSASSGPGLGVAGAEDVPTENVEDHRQASGIMRQEGVKKEADSCGRGEKIVSKANGDGGNGNRMAAISGNEKSIPPLIILIQDSDGSRKVLGNKMAAKEHVDVEGSGQNVVGNGDGGSQDNDRDSDNDSLTGRGTMLKRQKLSEGPEKLATYMSPGSNAGGKDSTPSKLDPGSSMKQEEPRGPRYKSPMPAGKSNPDSLYESSSSSSSDGEDDDPQFEIPTCFLPNVEKAEKV